LSLSEAFLASMAVVAGGIAGVGISYMVLLIVSKSQRFRRDGIRIARPAPGKLLIGILAFLVSWLVQSAVISFVLAVLLSKGLESVLGGFLKQFDPCIGALIAPANSMSVSIAVVKGFLAALIQTSAKYISVRRETIFNNAFSIGLGFGLTEAIFFSWYTYRSVAFYCPVYPTLNLWDLFKERIIATSFHVFSTPFLTFNSKGWGKQILWFILIAVLHGLIDSGLFKMFFAGLSSIVLHMLYRLQSVLNRFSWT